MTGASLRSARIPRNIMISAGVRFISMILRSSCRRQRWMRTNSAKAPEDNHRQAKSETTIVNQLTLFAFPDAPTLRPWSFVGQAQSSLLRPASVRTMH